jgi:hypothetical protein
MTGDNFGIIVLLFLKILAKNQQILMKLADVFLNKNFPTSKYPQSN